MIKSEKAVAEQAEAKTSIPKKPIDWDKILSYVVLGFLALVSFQFGGNEYTYFYEAIAFVIVVAFYALIPTKKDADGQKYLLYYSIPLIVFAVFCSFSKFWLASSFSSFSSALISLMGILAFYGLGLLCHHLKNISLQKVALAILFGLALLVLISLIATLADYGFFYAIRYANDVRYFDANPIRIADDYSLLNGFSIVSMSLKYSMQFAFVLSISLLSLLFISPKKNKLLFIGVAIAGGVGLLAMILVPYVFGLKLAIPFVLLALLLRFVKFPSSTPKWEKIVGYLALASGLLVLLILFINGLQGGIAVLTSGFLGQVFDNRFLSVVSQTIAVAFHSSSGGFDVTGLFGIAFDQGGTWLGATVNPYFFYANRIFEFAALYEGGLLGFLGLFGLLVFAVIAFRKYLHLDAELDGGKILVLLLVSSFVLYASLSTDSTPFNQNPGLYVSPLVRNAMILLLVFLIGYSYTPIFPFRKKVSLKEGEDD